MKTNSDPGSKDRQLIKLREFASAISVSVRSLYRMIDAGEVPRPVKQGQQSFFFAQDLEDHLAELRKQRQ